MFQSAIVFESRHKLIIAPVGTNETRITKYTVIDLPLKHGTRRRPLVDGRSLSLSLVWAYFLKRIPLSRCTSAYRGLPELTKKSAKMIRKVTVKLRGCILFSWNFSFFLFHTNARSKTLFLRAIYKNPNIREEILTYRWKDAQGQDLGCADWSRNHEEKRKHK